MKKDRKLRNIGIIAHVDAGKTTTTERILYYTGIIHKPGNIDDGNTVTDSDPQEAKRGITISSSAISTEWNCNDMVHQINIIDTPGHVDFAIEVARSLRVLDGVVALFCASSGVEPQSETVWSQSNRYGIPKLCFINKMDRIGADFFKVVHDIQNELNTTVMVLQVPIGEGDDFKGIVDLIREKALYWNPDNMGTSWEEKEIPDALKNVVQKWKERLLETIAGFDESILMKYLDNKPINDMELRSSIRSITVKQQAVPVLCGSSFKYIGVQPLLDGISEYLPAPEDIKYVKGINENMVEERRLRAVKTPFAALIFKVIADKYVGSLAMVRVYTGAIKIGETIRNPVTRQKNRISRILRIHADKFTELKEASAGDIVGLVGLKNVKTGHTLCGTEDSFILESIEVAEPVISVAIEPKSNDDEKRFGEAVAKILDEDPSLQVSFDKQTGQTILHGMGELHLDVRLEKLRSDFGVAIQKGNPKVSFKERLQKSVEHTEVFKKQTGGNGQFAQITFTLGPCSNGQKGLEFVNEVKGGNIPKEFIPHVEKGFQQAMQSGVLAGYPLESLRVVLLDGKVHTQDSSGLDFEIVAKNGFKQVAALSNPVLLEPIMRAEIECPEDYLGKVTSDINRKRGIIMEIKEYGIKRSIQAQVPLLETFGYISDLRTLTSGRGTVSLSLLKYDKVPDTVLDRIVI